jgi:hypothetical protein
MSEHDLLLGDVLRALSLDGPSGPPVQLVADGMVWRGWPVTGTAWAAGLPEAPGQRAALHDLLAIDGYLHLDRAAYREAGLWVPTGTVRVRLASVSVWWVPSGPVGERCDADADGDIAVLEGSS